jgi:hypothetical protein
MSHPSSHPMSHPSSHPTERPLQLRSIDELNTEAKLITFIERCRLLAEYDRLLIDRARIIEIGTREQSIRRCVFALGEFRERIFRSDVVNMTNVVPVFAALQSEVDIVQHSLKVDSNRLYNRHICSEPRMVQSLITRLVDTHLDLAANEYVPIPEVSPTASESGPAASVGVDIRDLDDAQLRPDIVQRMIAGYNQYVLAAEAFHAACNEPCWDRMFEIMALDIRKLESRISKYYSNQDDVLTCQPTHDLSELEVNELYVDLK